jgi:hypothetical protein
MLFEPPRPLYGPILPYTFYAAAPIRSKIRGSQSELTNLRRLSQVSKVVDRPQRDPVENWCAAAPKKIGALQNAWASSKHRRRAIRGFFGVS